MKWKDKWISMCLIVSPFWPSLFHRNLHWTQFWIYLPVSHVIFFAIWRSTWKVYLLVESFHSVFSFASLCCYLLVFICSSQTVKNWEARMYGIYERFVLFFIITSDHKKELVSDRATWRVILNKGATFEEEVKVKWVRSNRYKNENTLCCTCMVCCCCGWL